VLIRQSSEFHSRPFHFSDAHTPGLTQKEPISPRFALVKHLLFTAIKARCLLPKLKSSRFLNTSIAVHQIRDSVIHPNDDRGFLKNRNGYTIIVFILLAKVLDHELICLKAVNVAHPSVYPLSREEKSRFRMGRLGQKEFSLSPLVF
jgi:hypothetical protein